MNKNKTVDVRTTNTLFGGSKHQHNKTNSMSAFMSMEQFLLLMYNHCQKSVCYNFPSEFPSNTLNQYPRLKVT
jgi:hypothetical protein